MDKLTSQSITLLRFPAAVLIVFIHAWGIKDMDADISGVEAGVLKFFSVVIPQFAVPLFFLFQVCCFLRQVLSLKMNIDRN